MSWEQNSEKVIKNNFCILVKFIILLAPIGWNKIGENSMFGKRWLGLLNIIALWKNQKQPIPGELDLEAGDLSNCICKMEVLL